MPCWEIPVSVVWYEMYGLFPLTSLLSLLSQVYAYILQLGSNKQAFVLTLGVPDIVNRCYIDSESSQCLDFANWASGMFAWRSTR